MYIKRIAPPFSPPFSQALTSALHVIGCDDDGDGGDAAIRHPSSNNIQQHFVNAHFGYPLLSATRDIWIAIVPSAALVRVTA